MKILLIQTAFIGDVFLTLPLVQKLKERHPNAEINVVANPAGSQIFKASPAVHKVFTLDKRGKHRGILSTIKFALKLRKTKYDLIYSPHRSFRSALIVFFTRGKKSIGFNNASAAFVYKEKVKYRKEIHEVARNLSLLDFEFTKGENWKIQPKLEITENLKLKAEKLFENHSSGKNVALAPGSVWATKVYPKGYFEEIIAFLTKKSFAIFLIGGPKEFELCEELRGNNRAVFNAAGKLKILESVHLISKCDFLISNDSAPVHMAMAAGVPALTLYVSTVPEFGFYPYLYGSRSLSYNELSCKPCGVHGKTSCPTGTFDCGKLLTPGVVIKELEEYFVNGL